MRGRLAGSSGVISPLNSKSPVVVFENSTVPSNSSAMLTVSEPPKVEILDVLMPLRT